MRMILLITLLSICFTLAAPEYKTLPIERSESIDPYKAIKRAMAIVESSNNTKAINYDEFAYGLWQVRGIRLRDYYDRTNIRYTLSDMLDSCKARRVIDYYSMQYGPYRIDEFIRSWNGSGKKTFAYLERVKEQLTN